MYTNEGNEGQGETPRTPTLASVCLIGGGAGGEGGNHTAYPFFSLLLRQTQKLPRGLFAMGGKSFWGAGLRWEKLL